MRHFHSWHVRCFIQLSERGSRLGGGVKKVSLRKDAKEVIVVKVNLAKKLIERSKEEEGSMRTMNIYIVLLLLSALMAAAVQAMVSLSV